jgi:hypothetical protein
MYAKIETMHRSAPHSPATPSGQPHFAIHGSAHALHLLILFVITLKSPIPHKSVRMPQKAFYVNCRLTGLRVRCGQRSTSAYVRFVALRALPGLRSTHLIAQLPRDPLAGWFNCNCNNRKIRKKYLSPALIKGSRSKNACRRHATPMGAASGLVTEPAEVRFVAAVGLAASGIGSFFCC